MRNAPLRRITAATAITLAVMTQAPSLASAAPSPTSGNQGLAKGRLLQADGRPAAGATVTIYGMPVETAENPIAVGNSQAFAVIGQFRTDKQGRYAAAVKRANLAQFRDASGNVNAELIARDASGNIASMTFGLAPVEPTSAKMSATSTGRAAVAASPLTPVAIADLTLTTSDQSVAKNSSPVEKVSAALVASGGDPASRMGDPGSVEPKAWVKAMATGDSFVDGTGASDIVATPAIVCGWSLVQDLGTNTVWVGGTYVKATGVTADLQYVSGASSSLGVGVSTSGKYGTYSASGSVSRSASGSIDYPKSAGFQHDYTGFRYGKYGYWCDTQPNYLKYQVYATSWAGGSSIYHPTTSPSAPYCVPNVAGSVFTKQTSTAYNYSTGASTAGDIGINLSTQTGYTSALKVVYTFASARKLCGTNDYPGGVPKRLVAAA